MVLHKMFLEFLSRKKWFLASTATSCSPLFLIVYDILWSSKMFHHFFRTFFTCYSTRCLLKFLLVITISRIHCNFGFISMVYACYSTRCLLNLLENKRFLHSMHVIALYVCWISFSEKNVFFTCTATSCSSLFSVVFYSTTSSFICFITFFLHNFIFMIFTCSMFITFCTNYFLTKIVVSYHMKTSSEN